MNYTATSAVFFNAGPSILDAIFWGVPMMYVMHQGQGGQEWHVERSVRSYPVLEGPVVDRYLPRWVWFRVDISAEGISDIAEAWLPVAPGSQEELGHVT